MELLLPPSFPEVVLDPEVVDPEAVDPEVVLIAMSSSSINFSKIPCLEICLNRACLSLPK